MLRCAEKNVRKTRCVSTATGACARLQCRGQGGAQGAPHHARPRSANPRSATLGLGFRACARAKPAHPPSSLPFILPVRLRPLTTLKMWIDGGGVSCALPVDWLRAAMCCCKYTPRTYTMDVGAAHVASNHAWPMRLRISSVTPSNPHFNVLGLALRWPLKLPPSLRLRFRDLAHRNNVGATAFWTTGSVTVANPHGTTGFCSG